MDTIPLPFGGALQVAVSALARDALSVGLDGTLPTNQHYQSEYGIGAGTLQRALDQLRSRRVLKTTSRGHLGRVVTALNIAGAWRAGALDPVRVVLPPAGPVEITMLQLVVAEALSKLGIPHTARNLRAASTRLALLQQGEADLAVVSTGGLSGADRPFLSRSLGVGTYYGLDRIAVVSRRDETAPRRLIAIDRDSPDHRAITHGEFPIDDGYTYVQVPFPHIPAAVLAKRVDAGIWHITPSVIPLDQAGIKLGSLTTHAGITAWANASEAVLAVGPMRPELNSVIMAMDMTELARRQADAIAADTGLVPD